MTHLPRATPVVALLVALVMAYWCVAQPSPPPAPAGGMPGTADNSDWVPVRSGEPLVVRDAQGRSARRVNIYEGTGARDKSDPNILRFYIGLSLELVEADAPAEGLPFVHEAYADGNHMVARLVFRLNSLELARAAKEYLLAKFKARFDERRKANAHFAIDIDRVPAHDLALLIQDPTAGGGPLTIAEQTVNVSTQGDTVDLYFRFSPSNYRVFLDLGRAGKLSFAAVYRYSAQRMEVATGSLQASVSLRSLVSQELSSQQLDGKAPVYQGHKDRVERAFQMTVRRGSVGDSETALAYLQPETAVLAEAFEREDLGWDQFVVRPGYEAAAFADYLKAFGVVRTDVQRDAVAKTTGKENETNTRTGLSGAFSLPGVLNIGGGDEKEKRELESVYLQTGVQFERSKAYQGFEPKSVRVYKIAAGKFDKTIDSVNSVSIGKGKAKEYLVESPFGTNWTTRLVAAGAERVVTATGHLKGLYDRRAALASERAVLLAQLTTCHEAADKEALVAKTLPAGVEAALPGYRAKSHAEGGSAGRAEIWAIFAVKPEGEPNNVPNWAACSTYFHHHHHKNRSQAVEVARNFAEWVGVPKMNENTALVAPQKAAADLAQADIKRQLGLIAAANSNIAETQKRVKVLLAELREKDGEANRLDHEIAAASRN